MHVPEPFEAWKDTYAGGNWRKFAPRGRYQSYRYRRGIKTVLRVRLPDELLPPGAVGYCLAVTDAPMHLLFPGGRSVRRRLRP